MKTVKRKAEVGERIHDFRTGRTETVKAVYNKHVAVAGYTRAFDAVRLVPHKDYEVIEDEPKIEMMDLLTISEKALEELRKSDALLNKKVEDEPAIPPHSTAATEEVALNPILREIHWKIVSQTEKGLKKYGKPVHPDNHSLIEWIDHAVEESIDHITYLLMMKKKIEEGGESK